jgi:hypothetical protein
MPERRVRAGDDGGAMTSLLPGPASVLADARPDARHRRPLLPVALLGGAVAAFSTLLVCLAVGVVGWFLSDAGAHGAPHDGMRVGAIAWLMAHGSGVRLGQVAVTAAPLGISALTAWAVWRLGLLVGESVSGHGPDADAIADGERDWTVLRAVLGFTVGYLVVALLTAHQAADARIGLATGRVVLWCVVLCLAVGGAAIATGSGRAAIWAAVLPASLRASAATALRVLGWWLAVSTVVLLAALVVDFGTAVNLMSRLHTDAGDASVYTVVSATVVPNAALLSSSYLLGPGFAVGVGTLVSPTLVQLGPLPMFPLLAALPDNGPTPAWTPYLMALAPVVAALAVARSQRRRPTRRYEQGALRGCAGGVLAGVLLTFLTTLAGGAVGPGRMRDVGAPGLDVLVHALPAFGLGGLVGGVVMTWWQRRASRPAEEPDPS